MFVIFLVFLPIHFFVTSIFHPIYFTFSGRLSFIRVFNMKTSCGFSCSSCYLLKFSFVSSYMIKFIFKFTSYDSIVLILIILGSEILVVGNTADTGLKIHVLLWLEAFGSTLFPTSEVVLFPSSPSGLSSFYFHFHSSDSYPYYACP